PAIPPPAALVGTDQVGFSDVQVDPDDTVRRAILYQDDEAGQYESLAFRVAARWLAAERGPPAPARPPGGPQLRPRPTRLLRFSGDDGPYAEEDPAGYQMLIDFEGNAPFRSFAMDAVLSGEVPPSEFRDKMVFVGATADSITDLRRVPFGLWPGV